MIDYLVDCVDFTSKTCFAIVFLLFNLLCLVVLMSGKSKNCSSELGFKIVNYTQRYRERKQVFEKEVLSKDELKARRKKEKELKETSSSRDKKNKLFVMEFKGDMQASGAETLAKEVTAVLSVATPEDEVMIKIHSPGGSVSGYGLCASQLARIREAGLTLTVCVDEIAASGGYMMACVAHKIVAAPFSIVGSIGVVAEFPNFNKLLKKCSIDYEQETAGQYKRTLSMFGDNSDPAAREKFRDDLEQCHALFRELVVKYRPCIDADKVCTGAWWLASNAIKEHLVDEIMTSDDFIAARLDAMDIYSFEVPKKKKGIVSKLKENASEALSGMLNRNIRA